MVTVTEWKMAINRWKKGVIPIKIDEQHYGEHLVRMLERYSGRELAGFDDPLEAVVFILLIGVMRESDRDKPRRVDP